MKSSLKYLMVIGMTLYGSGDRIKAITPSTEMEADSIFAVLRPQQNNEAVQSNGENWVFPCKSIKKRERSSSPWNRLSQSIKTKYVWVPHPAGTPAVQIWENGKEVHFERIHSGDSDWLWVPFGGEKDSNYLFQLNYK